MQRLNPNNARVALTAVEISTMFGISRRTLYRLVAAGDFPRPRKVGQLSRWDAEAVNSWWHARTQRAR